MTDRPAERSTSDMALRRANVLAQLDLERMRRAPGREAELDRRLERIEAAIVELYRLVRSAA